MQKRLRDLLRVVIADLRHTLSGRPNATNGWAAALGDLFTDVSAGLNRPGLGLYEAQWLLGDLTSAKLGLRARLGELRNR